MNSPKCDRPPNITVAGCGYVGLSNALLLAQRCRVRVYEVNAKRVDQINARISPFHDAEMSAYLAKETLTVSASTAADYAYADANYVVVATPTNYDPQAPSSFDTSSIESNVALALRYAPTATIIIKSTVPVGYSERLRQEFGYEDIVFSPEFLREGKALYDNLYPSRIIVGADSQTAWEFAQLLADCALKPNIPLLQLSPKAAEAVKLFANTYLAMRVAYFNELDTYAKERGIDTRDILAGVCLDERIGARYNNPSFGYGGYCLPKDSRQLLADYGDIPQRLITAIVESNQTRFEYIADQICAQCAQCVGVYRLAMKAGADNSRMSAIQQVMEILAMRRVPMILFEPSHEAREFRIGSCVVPVIADLQAFIAHSDVILANRMAPELKGVEHKVFTRDLFGTDR